MTIKEMIEKKRGYIENKAQKIDSAIAALVASLEGEEAGQFINADALGILRRAKQGIELVIDSAEKNSVITSTTNS